MNKQILSDVSPACCDCRQSNSQPAKVDLIEQELEIIKDSILQVIPAEAIYLFGSYAYGTPHENSDLDIYVVVPDDTKDLIERQADVRGNIRMNKRLAQHTNLMPMDLMLGRSSSFNRRRNFPTLEKTISQKGRLIHGR